MRRNWPTAVSSQATWPPCGGLRSASPDAGAWRLRSPRSISVTERAAYMGRIRHLARMVAQAYFDSRERLGFPLAPPQWTEQMTKKAA